jgi:flagellar biosynthesis chaperone FliJ
MSEQLKQLQDLEALLHEVNQEFARAARPLYRMTDLNNEQRQKIGAQLRAAAARWESVTQQISQALGTGSAPGVSRRNTTKADGDENQ